MHEISQNKIKISSNIVISLRDGRKVIYVQKYYSGSWKMKQMGMDKSMGIISFHLNFKINIKNV